MTTKKLILIASLALVFSVCAFAIQNHSTVSPGNQMTGSLPLTGVGMKVSSNQLPEKNADVAARAGDIVIAFHATQHLAAARAGDIVIATAKAGDIVIAFHTGKYQALAV